jgi:hypothetical protein
MERVVETGVGPEFLLSEADGNRSRENIVIAASQTLLAGAILGLISIGALSSTAAAAAGNTGAATITAAPAVAVGTPTGVYKLTAVSAGATAEWLLTSPDGVPLGNVTTAVEATIAGIGPFTIADPGTDPAIGDQFTITVVDAAATGEGQYVKHDPEGTNGSQNVAGILYDSVTTGAGETARAVAIVRDAEVIDARLVYDDHDTTEKAAVRTALEAMGVIVRVNG